MYKDFFNLSKKEIIKILAIVILSDGTLVNSNKKRLIRLLTSDKSECQHHFFNFLCKKVFNSEPKKCLINSYSTFYNNTNKYIQSTLSGKEIVNKMLTLSPTYKTTKGNLSVDDFLSSNQPTIKFLNNSSNKIKWLALRTWFDFDGSITPCFKLKSKTDKKKGKFYNYFQVQFECEIRIAETNPNLVKELTDFCSTLNLGAIKKKKNNWSGIDGICISNLNDVQRFVSYGPITDVPISRKSKRFLGIPKREICLAVSKVLKDNSIKKSKYFKTFDEAKKYKDEMDIVFRKLINTKNLI